MSLSEYERRALDEIEQHLASPDAHPVLGRRGRRPARVARRGALVAGAVLIAAGVALASGVGDVVSLAGFVVVVCAAYAMAVTARWRQLGRDGGGPSTRPRTVRDYLVFRRWP